MKLPLRSLVLPFFITGLSVAVFLAEATETEHSRHDSRLEHWVFLIATPLVCAGLGSLVAPRARASWKRFIFLAPFAGALNGLVCLWAAQYGRPRALHFEEYVSGVFIALLAGAFLSILFVPSLALVVTSASGHPEDARRGSIYDRARRRGVWAAALTAVAGASLLAAAFRAQGEGGFTALLTTIAPLGAALVLLTILALHIASLRRVRMLGKRVTRARTKVEPIAEIVDYGVGDAVREEVAAPQNPYRENETVVRVHRGDASIVTRLLVRKIVGASLGSIVAIAALSIATACPTAAQQDLDASGMRDRDAIKPLYLSHQRGAMIGVDDANQHAFVENAETRTIETISLKDGKVIERHEFPFARDSLSDQSTDDEALRVSRPFGSNAARIPVKGPHHVDATTDIVVAPDGARFLFREAQTDDGAWRFLDPAASIPSDRARPVPNLTPTDSPLFAPDGNAIAWTGPGERGCTQSRCDKYLYIAYIRKSGRIITVRGDPITDGNAPQWSVDGKYVYVSDRPVAENEVACLWRIPAERASEGETLFCRNWRSPKLEQDATGTTGIVSGFVSASDSASLAIAWIHLPSGFVKRELVTREFTAVTHPTSDGLVLAMQSKGFAIFDLAANCKREVEGTEGLKSPVHAKWVDDRHLIVQLEHEAPEVEIVSVDAYGLRCVDKWQSHRDNW